MAAGAEGWNALNIQILADLFQVKKKTGHFILVANLKCLAP